MTNDLFTDFWNLLDLTEDLLAGGYRRPHPEPPALGPSTVVRVAAVSQPDGAYDLPEERLRGLAEVAAEVATCEKCGLCAQRTHTVPGEGHLDPLVMVIGEGPGADEDRSGRPFVGRAGQYLDKWLAAIGLSRDSNAYIGNVVKCRPPGNRDPLPEETQACQPYLDRQIRLIRPRAILTVGRIASQKLIGSELGIGKLRGSAYTYRGIPLVATYHPSGVLRNPELRRAVWDDLRRLKALLDERVAGE